MPCSDRLVRTASASPAGTKPGQPTQGHVEPRRARGQVERPSRVTTVRVTAAAPVGQDWRDLVLPIGTHVQEGDPARAEQMLVCRAYQIVDATSVERDERYRVRGIHKRTGTNALGRGQNRWQGGRPAGLHLDKAEGDEPRARPNLGRQLVQRNAPDVNARRA